MKVDRIIESLPSLAADQRDGVRANAERLAASGTAAQRAAAAQVLDALAALEEAEHRQLVERLCGMEVAGRVAEAFRKIPLTETEAKLVQVLIDHPRSTSTELSSALGWGGQIWHLKFGEMCKARQVYLWPAPPSDRPDALFYCGILADLSDDRRWTIKPTVEPAFAAMGFKARAA
jgi:hypothetical protein